MKKFLLGLVTATIFLGCSSDDSSNSSDDSNQNQDPNQWTIEHVSIIGTWEIRKRGRILPNNTALYLEDVVPCEGNYDKWIIEELPPEQLTLLNSGKHRITTIRYGFNQIDGVPIDCYEYYNTSSGYPYIFDFHDRIMFSSDLDGGQYSYTIIREVLQKNSNSMTLKSSSVSGGWHSVSYFVKVD